MESNGCTAWQFYHESLYRPPFEWISPAVGIAASIILVFSFIYVYRSRREEPDKDIQKRRDAISKCIIGAWTLLPPLWLMIEYWWLLGYWHMGRDHCIETLTTREELTSKFWVAAVLTLVALYRRDVTDPSG